ncbi:MAG: hypothetical protein CV082_11430 [Candidatus Brocadia sp. BL1]|nr:MAG: hypothetical protein CV082_11430 [Candidatus Brocadia sp. BL1]
MHAFLSGNSIPLYSHSLRGIAPIFYQSFPKIIAHLFFGTHTWVLGLREIHNADFLDLFEWGQGHGIRLAMRQLEINIAWKGIFTPFNCRDLYITT